MEDFKKYLMQVIEKTEWQNSEKCKSAAKDIMDFFSDVSGNTCSIMDCIYHTLYVGFDTITDTLKEEGIDGTNLWKALYDDVTKRYADKQFARILAGLSIIAQKARNFNDIAYKKYKETNDWDEISIVRAIKCLVKLRKYSVGIPPSFPYSLDESLSISCSNKSALIFANTFRKLDLEMYNKEEFHEIFIDFYKDFSKSNIIKKELGNELIKCAAILMSKLDANSKYMKLYLDYCDTIKNGIE